MSQPAQVTSRADWDDVVGAIAETVDDIRDIAAEFRQRSADMRGEQTVTDPDHARDIEDQQLDDDRRRDEELDAQYDGTADGRYDTDLDAS
ncbi:hypothetical protein GCM10022255_085940 [Dactylosporangium darangshiense]|uniref:Uncharacterized protein n=1 Tax=Dactylosporangium darangshiense TaxID=579108 RepID=A0ABP8DMP8_9ACTN